VLGRCIGVPTRYVEGYIARFEKKDSDNMYIVKNSYAHAWAEAYIEGVGWIPFEATASYHNIRYVQWEKYESTQNHKKRAPADYSGSLNSEQHKEAAPVVDGKNRIEESFRGVLRSLIAAILATEAVIAAIVIYYNLLRYKYKRSFEEADYNGKVYILFLRILRLLKKEGFELGPDETVLMLACRVKDRFRYEGVSFIDVAEIYMRYRYAEAVLTENDYKKVAAYQLGLENKHRNEAGRWKVWLEEFIFLSKKPCKLLR